MKIDELKASEYGGALKTIVTYLKNNPQHIVAFEKWASTSEEKEDNVANIKLGRDAINILRGKND